MGKKIEVIHIKRLKGKIKNFECDYNGVAAKGRTAVMAYRNAKKKYELKETSDQLEIINADFDKTLEGVRV